MVFESESLKVKKENKTLEELYHNIESKKGEEKEAIVKRRVNQSFLEYHFSEKFQG